MDKLPPFRAIDTFRNGDDAFIVGYVNPFGDRIAICLVLVRIADVNNFLFTANPADALLTC